MVTSRSRAQFEDWCGEVTEYITWPGNTSCGQKHNWEVSYSPFGYQYSSILFYSSYSSQTSKTGRETMPVVRTSGHRGATPVTHFKCISHIYLEVQWLVSCGIVSVKTRPLLFYSFRTSKTSKASKTSKIQICSCEFVNVFPPTIGQLHVRPHAFPELLSRLLGSRGPPLLSQF